MIATFHNHTTWSDGQASPEAMYLSASEAGVEVLGLSDHFCLCPDGSVPGFSLLPDELADYLAELRALRGKGALEVVAGLEFDWFEQSRSVYAPYAESLPLDYRIGSVHFVGGQGFDIDASFWTAKSEDERDAVYAAYWRLVRGMAESRLFDLAGHLDLPKKFGFYPAGDLRALEDEALDAIQASGMAVELNTAGFRYPCADGYPSLGLLRRCREREIPATLSSDAHKPEHLLYAFSRGAALLREAGYTAVARFRNRERWSEPLEQAVQAGEGGGR
jgi:histidinol-phosphatase (PHP family)